MKRQIIKPLLEIITKCLKIAQHKKHSIKSNVINILVVKHYIFLSL